MYSAVLIVSVALKKMFCDVFIKGVTKPKLLIKKIPLLILFLVAKIMKKQKNVVVQYSPICFEVSKRRFFKKTDMEIEGQRQRP